MRKKEIKRGEPCIFIKQMLSYIWKKVNQEFCEFDNQYGNLSSQALFQRTRDLLYSKYVPYEYKHGVLLYNFMDKGCDHCNNDGIFGGCSFCDFITPNKTNIFHLTLLYKKSVQDYSRLISELTQYVLEPAKKKTVVQFISGYNTLSEKELPKAVGHLLRQSGLFIQNNILTGFDTRADSISESTIKHWKQLLNGPIGVNIGIETANEWLRNHWLNKEVSNTTIQEALAILKQQHCMISLSLLIGIPGLSQAQSLYFFREALEYCMHFQPDRIMCTPLINQRYTLQNLLYTQIPPDEESRRRGLRNGQLSIYTLFTAFFDAMQKWPEYRHKIALNAFLFYPYKQEYNNLAGSEEDPEDIRYLLKLFGKCIKLNDYFPVLDAITVLQRSPSYQAYLERIKRQDQGPDTDKSLLYLCRLICKNFWPDQVEQYYKQFADELLCSAFC